MMSILKELYFILLCLVQWTNADVIITSSFVKRLNYISKQRVENIATYNKILNITSSKCRAHCHSADFCATTCWDKLTSNCYLMKNVIILNPKSPVESTIDDALICYNSENRVNFLEGHSTSAGNANYYYLDSQDGPLDSVFLNKLGSDDEFHHCCAYNWYAVDLGDDFVPPATIKVYNIQYLPSLQFYLSSTPLPVNKTTPTRNANERLSLPTKVGDNTFGYYPFYIDASKLGKTFLIYNNHGWVHFHVGHIDVTFE